MNIKMVEEEKKKFLRRSLFQYRSQDFESKQLIDAKIEENLDCSFIIDYQSIENLEDIDEIIYNANRIDKIILPSYLQEFVSIQEKPDQYDKQCTIINSYLLLSHPHNYNQILSNDQTTQMNYGYNRDVQQIDLSKFVSLTVLKLSKIGNDIILPNQLQELEIKGQGNIQGKFLQKIINFPEKLTKCKIENFEIDEIDTQKFEKCELQNCKINDLYLQSSKFQKQILKENLVNNILCNFDCKEINYFKNDINNLIFCTSDIQKLSVYQLNQLHILTEQSAKIVLNDYATSVNILDLSKLNLLKIIIITEQLNQIVFPTQIKQIHIQKLTSEVKLLNFSSFDLLEILEIDEHYIEYIVLPKQNKKKVTLSFNPQIENSIYIETSATNEQNSFIDNVKKIQVQGLVDIIFSKKSQQNNLDFSIFSDLQILEINNIQKQIQLPKSIVELIIMNHDNNLDLDLKMFQNIQKVQLENCKVDKIIGNFQLFLTNCEVNCVRTYKQRTIEQTKIKIYEQTINLKYIGVTKTNRFQTIIIKQPEYIQSVNLYGIKNIVFKNQNPDENVLDFTQFKNLESVFLVDIICQSIIFGKRQTTIKIFNKNQAKITKLDFSQCNKLKESIINNLNIKLVVLTDQIIEFQVSKIKFIKLYMVDKLSFQRNYFQYCDYIVLQRTQQDQRLVYRKGNLVDCNQRKVILSYKIDKLYQNMIKLIDE